jgi:hypothetical protein
MTVMTIENLAKTLTFVFYGNLERFFFFFFFDEIVVFESIFFRIDFANQPFLTFLPRGKRNGVGVAELYRRAFTLNCQHKNEVNFLFLVDDTKQHRTSLFKTDKTLET